MSAEDKIRETVTSNDVVLFMKGTASMPQCGFSSQIAGILNYMGVEYHDVNVLADDAIRQGIKDYSDWPTIPQLYVKGEFIGGCDIVRDMTLSGELDGLLAENEVSYNQDAADEIRKANSDGLTPPGPSEITNRGTTPPDDPFSLPSGLGYSLFQIICRSFRARG